MRSRRARDYILRNRAHWDERAAEFVEPGEIAWASREPTWGIWGVPESELRVLPEAVAGKESIELGCGTGYVSAWLARRGARPVGIDNSAAQLATARRLQREHRLAFPLVHGDGERTPFPAARFDLAISEYGVCLWGDPHRWVPEAARILRVGGELIFLTNSALLMLCVPTENALPAGDRLVRPAFGMHRMEWPDEVGVEFHLSHGDWVRLLRRSGFEIEDLIEVRAPAEGTTRYPFVSLEWARRWPCEEVWKARRR